MSKGTLYGVGIGPGDPELITLKALRLIRENQIIGIPKAVKEYSPVYKIVKPVYPEIEDKTFLECNIPMSKNKAGRDAAYAKAVKAITDILDQGENVVFLNLGDPTIYGTYMYIHQMVEALGYPTEIVSGIPSFCAIAARLNTSLSERSDMLHIVPACYENMEALSLPGNKVLMKSGSSVSNLKDRLQTLDADIMMIENCGMENERIFYSADELTEDTGYFSTIIIKEHKKPSMLP